MVRYVYMKSGILKAIKFAGTQQRLAELLEEETGDKCFQQKVQSWLTKGYVPPYWVIPMEKVTGVPRHMLNRKIYPREKVAA